MFLAGSFHWLLNFGEHINILTFLSDLPQPTDFYTYSHLNHIHTYLNPFLHRLLRK